MTCIWTPPAPRIGHFCIHGPYVSMMMTRCFDSLCPTQGLRGDGPQRHQGIEDNNGQALEWDEGKKRGDIPMANNQFHHSENIHSRMDKINFNFLPTKHSHSWHCESHFWPLWYSCILASSPWSNWHLRGGSESFPDKHWGQQFRASLLSVIIEQLEQERAWHEVTPFKHWHSEQPSRHWDPSWCSMSSTTQPKSWKLRDLRNLSKPKKLTCRALVIIWTTITLVTSTGIPTLSCRMTSMCTQITFVFVNADGGATYHWILVSSESRTTFTIMPK